MTPAELNKVIIDGHKYRNLNQVRADLSDLRAGQWNKVDPVDVDNMRHNPEAFTE